MKSGAIDSHVIAIQIMTDLYICFGNKFAPMGHYFLQFVSPDINGVSCCILRDILKFIPQHSLMVDFVTVKLS